MLEQNTTPASTPVPTPAKPKRKYNMAKRNRKNSKAARVRKLIAQGLNNQEIMAKVKCSPGTVYNERYRMNHKKGLGALPKEEVNKEGINSPAAPAVTAAPAPAPAVAAPAAPAITVTPYDPFPDTYLGTYFDRDGNVVTTTPTKPTLWQRVKLFFTGL